MEENGEAVIRFLKVWAFLCDRPEAVEVTFLGL